MNNPRPAPSSEFSISNYLGFLVPVEGKSSTFLCPCCNEPKLTISKDGLKYSCWACQDSKAIASKLRKLAGEGGNGKGKPTGQTSGLAPTTSNITGGGKSSTSDSDSDKIKSPTQALNVIRALWGRKLSYNVRTNEIWLAGKPLSLDTCMMMLADEEGISCSNDLLQRTVQYLAEQNPFDPVKEYLEECRAFSPYPVDKTNAAFLFFGEKDPLYNEMVWNFLLAMAWRVYNPGTKFDYALILQGRGGIGKSTFWRVLSNGFFSDSMGSTLGNADVQILNENWLCEWSEFETITGRHKAGIIKAFLSRSKDDVNLKYEKTIRVIKRRSVICGSVNEKQFLTDQTGNRRMWIVPVTWIMPPEVLETIREEVWSAVLVELFSGMPDLELSSQAKAQQAEENEKYLYSDPVMDELESYLDSQSLLYVTTSELLLHLQTSKVDWGIKGSDKAAQMRIAGFLQKLGWERTTKWVNGTAKKVWEKEKPPEKDPDLTT